MEYCEWDESWSCTFDDLKGRVLTSVVRLDNSMIFTDNDDSVFQLMHRQSCCEHVYIESIVGDLFDLINNPILMAEQVSNSNKGEVPASALSEDYVYDDDMNESTIMRPPKSYTWTFYKLATIKGYVDIRFFGSSNGCYSESADLICLKYEGKPNVD
jgi:hypothetical protein